MFISGFDEALTVYAKFERGYTNLQVEYRTIFEQACWCFELKTVDFCRSHWTSQLFSSFIPGLWPSCVPWLSQRRPFVPLWSCIPIQYLSHKCLWGRGRAGGSQNDRLAMVFRWTFWTEVRFGLARSFYWSIWLDRGGRCSPPASQDRSYRVLRSCQWLCIGYWILRSIFFRREWGFWFRLSYKNILLKQECLIICSSNSARPVIRAYLERIIIIIMNSPFLYLNQRKLTLTQDS